MPKHYAKRSKATKQKHKAVDSAHKAYGVERKKESKTKRGSKAGKKARH